MNSRRAISLLLLLSVILVVFAQDPESRRRVTPVGTPSGTSQRTGPLTPDVDRDRFAHFHDTQGNIVYVDTITGMEFVDSTATRIPKMQYPLFNGLTVGLNIWDLAMRAFGQKYGLGDIWVEASFHNRYFAVIAAGIGLCDATPSGSNFTFKTPLAPYFKLGGDYNFFYNNSPNYRFMAGLRYGFSSFNYKVSDVSLSDPYWDETVVFNIPDQTSTVGWFEIVFGVHVKIAGPFSMGWRGIYHKILHESGNATYGRPMYIPGFGKRSQAITGSFSLSYTF